MVTQILFISTHPVDSGKFTASHFGTSERSAYNGKAGKASGEKGKRFWLLGDSKQAKFSFQVTSSQTSVDLSIAILVYWRVDHKLE